MTLNQIFKHGGDTGGMSPGATWEPFEISEDEYNVLVENVLNTDLNEIAPHARYPWVKFKVDHTFDNFGKWLDWMSASCNKHRDSYRQEMEKYFKTQRRGTGGQGK